MKLNIFIYLPWANWDQVGNRNIVEKWQSFVSGKLVKKWDNQIIVSFSSSFSSFCLILDLLVGWIIELAFDTIKFGWVLQKKAEFKPSHWFSDKTSALQPNFPLS